MAIWASGSSAGTVYGYTYVRYVSLKALQARMKEESNGLASSALHILQGDIQFYPILLISETPFTYCVLLLANRGIRPLVTTIGLYPRMDILPPNR